MNPNVTYQSSAPGQYNNARKFRQLKFVIIVFVLFILAVLAYNFYQSRQFRVVSTNPGTNNVAAISPFFNVTFNRQLSKDGVSVTSDSKIIKSFDVNGMTLDINLNTPMDTNKQYTITIANISDTAGESISNKSFTFTPQDIGFDQLPQDQKDAIAKQKPPVADHNTTTTFDGMNSLVSHGYTIDQINDLTQAFNKYAPHAKTVIINSDSISAAPHNPNVDTTFATNFIVTIDSTVYKATIRNFDLSSLELQLVNPQTGKVVYNSGYISPTQ